jgi:hypothetical protein
MERWVCLHAVGVAYYLRRRDAQKRTATDLAIQVGHLQVTRRLY